ncbi:pyridoxamine 5'-phosphate oxidase family protein [Leifsonia sp. YAF41]|uniref:pyridoxamine 5'-phosphate oxidase family protein n=1 Tax=Leifsonia sp. YAF41 TaxID=3233086 RepID=UPI003F96523E
MSAEEVVRDLEKEECWIYLSREDVGRLATSVDGKLDIFPVNYYADGSSILIRTAPGTTLLALTVHDTVAFEVDSHTRDSAWSVVVHGRCRQLELQSEIDEADRTPLVSWLPTLKYRYVRLEPTDLTGRTFLRLPEADRY